MQKIGFGVQDKIIKEQVPAPFTFNFDTKDETIAIDVNPVLSFQSRKDFCDIVWSMFYSDGEYRTFLLAPAIRIASLYVYTNFKINLEDVQRTYLLTQYSDLHTALVNELVKHGCGADYNELEEAAEEYVSLKTQEAQTINAAIMANAHRSQLDILVESVLENLNSVLTKFAADNADVSAKELIGAFNAAKELNDQDSLVGKVLNFRFPKDGVDNDRSGKEGNGVFDEDAGGKEGR